DGHREIEAGSAAAEETLEHVHPTEADAELVAGQSRLGDDELRRPDPEAVADPHVFEEPLGCQVLAEGGPGEVRAGKLVPPVLVVLGRIGIDGFLRAPVDGHVGLLVAFEIELGHPEASVDGCLEDRGEYRIAFPFDLSRQSDAQRYDFHENLLSRTSSVMPAV